MRISDNLPSSRSSFSLTEAATARSSSSSSSSSPSSSSSSSALPAMASPASLGRPNRPSMKLDSQPPIHSPPHSSSRAETPRASAYSTSSQQQQDDPFASSFSGSSSSVASLQPPDYFQDQSRTQSPMPMPSEIPPTPGPSAVGRDHPWAKLWSGGGGGSGGVMPSTPGGGWTPGGLLGGGNLSLPISRRAPAATTQHPRLPQGSPLKVNGAVGNFKDPRPPSARSPSTHEASKDERSVDFSSVPLTSSYSLPIPGKKSGAGVSDDHNRFQGIECQTLVSYLAEDPSFGAKGKDPCGLLILDIRPSTSFAAGRVKSSINVCAPSTLLKRPGVTVQRIEADMLQCEEDKDLFARWKQGPTKDNTSPAQSDGATAGVERIVVLDTDTASIGDPGRPSVGGGGPCLVGLLKKFDAAGFAGELCWLVGGYARFANHTREKLPHLIEQGAPRGTDGADSCYGAGAGGSSHNSKSATFAGQLKLPGTKAGGSGRATMPTGSPSLVQRGLPTEAFSNQTTTAQPPVPRDGDAQGKQSSDGILRSNAACNPFYDNIRQNRELQHGITERIPLEVGDLTVAEKEALPPFLRRMVDSDASARAEVLAQGFFDVEKAERDRLMATMRQHTSESSLDPRDIPHPPDHETRQSSPPTLSLSSSPPSQNGAMQLSSPYCRISSNPSSSLSASSFPFSIAAAMERGAENRYNNIWTYEHSRVKVNADDTPRGDAVKGSSSCGSEYLNGSFVEPLREFGCHRQYIATQAPLPSTFETFWRAVWQQNCRTIAMLTREYESGRVQSHNYWSESSYGSSIKLRVLDERELDARGDPCGKLGAPMMNTSSTEGGGFFAEVAKDAGKAKNEPVMVVRKIELTYAGSEEAPRLIHHLQYIGWPDYSIPSDPEALLVFMDLTSQCQQEAHLALSHGKTPVTDGMKWTKESTTGPLMLHCSAGVGRTGTYAVVDSALDVLRRERARRRSVMPLSVWDNGTRVDGVCGDADRTLTDQDVEMSSADVSPTSSTGLAPVPQTPERSANVSTATGLQPWPRGTSASATEPFSFSGSAAGIQDGTAGKGHFPLFSTPIAGNAHFNRSTRRSLKRELSPSAHMEVDSAGSGSMDTSAGDPGRRASFASPPPMRRNRSSSSDVALSTTSSSDTNDSDFALAAGDLDFRDGRSRSSTSSSQQRAGWGHLGIRQPDGMDTPSRAMDGMSLGLNSASPANSTVQSARQSPCPPPGGVLNNSSSTSLISQNSSGTTNSSSASASTYALNGSSGRRGSLAKQLRCSEAISSPQQAAAAAVGSGTMHQSTSATTAGRSSSSSPPYASSAFGDVDLVRKATDVAREQRMSSVQTLRQFVFCYAAVLKGVLREMERDG